MKFCPNCGKEVKNDATFCPNCGGKVNVNAGGTTVNVNTTTVNTGSPAKSKVAAGVMGIIVGAFGVHNFYLGYTGKAVAQLLITVLSCGILSFASAIWGLIEGIMILTGSINTDAQGNPLGE